MLNMLMHWSFSDHLWGGQRWRSCEHLREALKCKGAVFTNMKGKYWHSMNLHAQMPYVHCTSIMNLASGPENKKPKSRVLPLQITAERRQGRGNIQCHKLRFCNTRSVSDYPHDSLVRGYTYGPRSRSCDIDAEALQVWASVTGPEGSCRQVCFLKPVSLKVANCIYAIVLLS